MSAPTVSCWPGVKTAPSARFAATTRTSPATASHRSPGTSSTTRSGRPNFCSPRVWMVARGLVGSASTTTLTSVDSAKGRTAGQSATSSPFQKRLVCASRSTVTPRATSHFATAQPAWRCARSAASGRLISTAVSCVAASSAERSPPSAWAAMARSEPWRKASNQPASIERGSSRTSTDFITSPAGNPKRDADSGTSASGPEEKQKSWKTLGAPPGWKALRCQVGMDAVDMPVAIARSSWWAVGKGVHPTPLWNSGLRLTS